LGIHAGPSASVEAATSVDSTPPASAASTMAASGVMRGETSWSRVRVSSRAGGARIARQERDRGGHPSRAPVAPPRVEARRIVDGTPTSAGDATDAQAGESRARERGQVGEPLVLALRHEAGGVRSFLSDECVEDVAPALEGAR